jgi:hypothetical protein
MKSANKITGANADGPRRLPIGTPRAARIAQFRRSVLLTRASVAKLCRCRSLVVFSLVEAWAELHQEELLADWELLRQGRRPAPIAPLQ